MSADRSLQSSRSWKSRVRDTERSRASLHRARSTMLAGLLTLLTPTAFASWPVNIDGGTIEYDIARDMVVDSAGDVIAAGTLDGQFMVTKRKGLNGDAIWTTSLQIFAIESGMATAVAVDAAGDLIAAGFVEFPSRRDFCVIKLDGATGSTLWYRFLNGGGAGDSAAYDLILNGAGDVFATGYVDGPTAGTARLAVFKLDNANGATHWEHIYPHVSGAKYGFSFGKADMGHELALDPAGNVVVAGSLTDFMLYYGYLESFGQFTVIKLDGSTGSELWMYRPEWFLSCAFSVVVDAVGDVYAGGSRNGPDVVKLSGASGQVLWTSVLVNEGAEVQKVALAPNGDVVASGWADYYPQKFDSNTAVARIDGMSGLGVWEHRFASRLSEQMPFALDSHGDVYLAGVLDRLIVSVPASYHLNVEVVRLSGTSG